MTYAPFDPDHERSLMQEFALPYAGTFVPSSLRPIQIASNIFSCVDLLLQCYWIGLIPEAKPRLSAIVEWMREHSPPDRAIFLQQEGGWMAGWYAQYSWWRSFGLAKWLVGESTGVDEFAKALEVMQKSRQEADPDQLLDWREEARDTLYGSLPMALGANEPSLGLRLLEEVGSYRPRAPERPVKTFGRWACEHLASGKPRDTAFVQRGQAMLNASLLPNFFQLPLRTDPALWLKAIYFDSGVTKTAEETMLRAYDHLPGVARPDFVFGKS